MSDVETARDDVASAGPPRSGRSFFPVWLTAFLAISAIGAVWALANPIGNSPDEPAQIARAAALVRGQWIGTPVPREPVAYTQVRVPRTYALALDGTGGPDGAHDCYHFQPSVSAACERIAASSRSVPVLTYFGHYPPLYFAVVGLPSLLTDGISGLYLMRLVSVLCSAALLASALAVAWKWGSSPLLIGGIVVVSTPTEFFLASSVNASGLEVAAAVCTWVAALVMLRDHAHDPPRGLIVVLASAACVLALSRPISTVWLLLIAGCLVAAGWRRVPVGRLLRRRDVRTALGAVSAAVLGGIVWVVAVNGTAVVPEGPIPATVPLSSVVSRAVALMWGGLAQVAGDFGWSGTNEPAVGVLLLAFGAAVPLVVCLARGSNRDLRVLALIIGCAVVVPLVLAVAAARHDGLEEQGRYFLPFWVGVPLFAAATQRPLPGDGTRRLSRAMVVTAVAALLLGFGWNLHRVTVGMHGPGLPWNTPARAWHPPVPATLLDVAALASVVTYALVVLKMTGSPADAAPSAGRGGRRGRGRGAHSAPPGRRSLTV
jgi:hypothetical protein